jgi:hypothetical protein
MISQDFEALLLLCHIYHIFIFIWSITNLIFDFLSFDVLFLKAPSSAKKKLTKNTVERISANKVGSRLTKKLFLYQIFEFCVLA